MSCYRRESRRDMGMQSERWRLLGGNLLTSLSTALGISPYTTLDVPLQLLLMFPQPLLMLSPSKFPLMTCSCGDVSSSSSSSHQR